MIKKDEWVDISSESKRVYRFPNSERVTIAKPVKLLVTDNGHRIEDADGGCHYIPMGWIHLKWDGGFVA